MITATIKHFDALTGIGQVITTGGKTFSLRHSDIDGVAATPVPTELDYLRLDRIDGLACKVAICPLTNLVYACTILRMPRAA